VDAQQWVGVLFFLIGVCMLEVCLSVGALQAYVLPLRRFALLSRNLANVKWGTAVHTIILVFLFFLISGVAGMSGFVVMSCLFGLWIIILSIVIIVMKRNAAKNKPPPGVLGEHAGRRGSNDGSFERRGSADSFGGPDGLRNSVELSEQGSVNISSGSFALTPPDAALRNSPRDLTASEKEKELQAKRRRRRRHREGEWVSCPAEMPVAQMVYGVVNCAMLVVVLAILLAVLFGWKIDDYLVIRGDVPEVEYQPTLNAKSLQFIYAFPHMATDFQLQLYVKLFTQECGKQYTKSVSDKTKDIKEAWIDKYHINMAAFLQPDYHGYNSVDEWFVRALNSSFRPLPADENAVVSPADCRLLVFEKQADTLIWLKGYAVDYDQLLGGLSVTGYRNYFLNSAVVIARLAPQDYHRFHSPVSGTVVSIHRLGGSYWSVSSDAARSGNQAFLNVRTVILIDAGPRIGYVAYIGIGATCVGSVRLDVEPLLEVGSTVTKGQVIGSMHFGGSTVLMMFASGRIVFDEVIVQRSRFGVETRVDVNSQIGVSR
jgi:phosphatidylserine decarboxylase